MKLSSKERRQLYQCRRVCPTKIGHTKKADAELQGRLEKRPYWRVYQCEVCKLWFVTTKPDRPRGA